MKRALAAAGVVLVLAGVVYLSVRGRGGDEGVEVNTEAVVRGDISRIVKASGEIDPKEKVNISAHVIGKIEKLYVEEGDWIEAGQPFLQLEQEGFIAVRNDWRARLERAETDVKAAEVGLADAKLKLQRSRRLSAEGIFSTEQLEAAELAKTRAELGLEQAKQSVSQARANLEKAEDDLAKTTIYAPISGKVISLSAEEGEVVVTGTMNNPASIIGVIADLSEILAEVDVDETEIVHVHVGQEADLEVDAIPDHPYHGKVVEVGSSGFSLAKQPDVTFFKVKVLLADADKALRPGMSVRAEIDTATHRNVPVVPIQAVVDRQPKAADGKAESGEGRATTASTTGAERDDEVPVVFLVEDGHVRQQPVTTGISDTTRVEISRGVEPGQRVVTGPYRNLRDLEDGDAVKVAKPAETSGERRAAKNGEREGS